MVYFAPENTDFVVGDIVECANDEHYQFMVQKLHQYRVKSIRRSLTNNCQIITIDGSPIGIYGSRFRLIKPAQNNIMPTTNFTLGQKLTVIDNTYSGNAFNIGEVVTFEEYCDDRTYIRIRRANGTVRSGWRANRFEPVRVSNQPNNNPMPNRHSHRAPNGRFSPVQSSQPAVAQALVLRPGAIYQISGGGTGRFVGQVKGYATLTVHGKPIAVKVERVRLASKEDVSNYLADSKANK